MGYQMEWMLAQPLEQCLESDLLMQELDQHQGFADGIAVCKEDVFGERTYVGNDVGSRDGISDGMDVGLAVGVVLGRCLLCLC